MKTFIHLITIVVSFYAGIWNLFIKSIISACVMFGAGTLTGTAIGWTVLKCFFALPVTWMVYALLGVALFAIYYFVKGDL